MSQQIGAAVSYESSSTEQRRLTFPPDSVAAVYRGCGAGCRANKNTKPPLVQCPLRRASAGRRHASNKWSLRFTLGYFYTPTAAYEHVPQQLRLQWRKKWEKSFFKLEASAIPTPASDERFLLEEAKSVLKRYEARDKRSSRVGSCWNVPERQVLMNNCENSCVVILKYKSQWNCKVINN